MLPRGCVPLAVTFGFTLVAGHARADEDVCKDSYEQSQTLMLAKAEKSTLLPAREMLRTCMRAGCKDWIVADCSKWLGEVEGRIPTVVFAARDTSGRDVTDVRVESSTGSLLAPRLDGRAVELEAGDQTFVFVRADGTRREERALVREGQKTQSVTAVFDAPPGAPGPPKDPAPGTTLGPERKQGTPVLRMVGYGVGVIGAIGIGIGTVFGVRALDQKNEGCDANGDCDPKLRAQAIDSAAVSTGAFVVGGILLAGGAALVIFAPSSSVRLQASPAVARGSGGLVLGGVW